MRLLFQLQLPLCGSPVPHAHARERSAGTSGFKVTRKTAGQLRHYLDLTERVISQTERRLLHGESVPATEKIVSIFEPHADVIRKNNRSPTAPRR